jgi:hypothetical protein
MAKWQTLRFDSGILMSTPVKTVVRKDVRVRLPLGASLRTLGGPFRRLLFQCLTNGLLRVALEL